MFLNWPTKTAQCPARDDRLDAKPGFSAHALQPAPRRGAGRLSALTHESSCPAESGIAPICTCGALFKAAIAEGRGH